jgi:hypothetical protein
MNPAIIPYIGYPSGDALTRALYSHLSLSLSAVHAVRRRVFVAKASDGFNVELRILAIGPRL